MASDEWHSETDVESFPATTLECVAASRAALEKKLKIDYFGAVWLVAL